MVQFVHTFGTLVVGQSTCARKLRDKKNNTIAPLRTIRRFNYQLQDEGVIQKLTKRKITSDDIDEMPTSKLRKPVNRNATFERTKRVTPLTRLLDGKEICVINGTDELTKERVEETLRQHSAKIVQNSMNTTFCVIVGNSKTVRNRGVRNNCFNRAFCWRKNCLFRYEQGM